MVDNPDAELRQRCKEGVRQRYGANESPQVQQRLAYELDIMTKKGFAPYVLAVWHLTRFRHVTMRWTACAAFVP